MTPISKIIPPNINYIKFQAIFNFQLQGTRLLPSPNQLRNKIIIKHKAPNEPAQQVTRSNSLPLSASPPVDEDSLEEDDNLSKFSHDVKVSAEKRPIT